MAATGSFSMVVCVGVGAVLGTVLTNLILRLDEPATSSGPTEPAVRSRAPDTRRNALADTAIELRPAIAAEPPPTPVLPETEPEPTAPLEDRLDQAPEQQWNRRLTAHREEARDPEWSRAATPRLTEDLVTIAAQGQFRLIGTDCKTTTCSVELEWSTYADAAKTYESLLVGAYRMACTTAILLPRPQDESAPYRGTLLLDCEQAQTDG